MADANDYRRVWHRLAVAQARMQCNGRDADRDVHPLDCWCRLDAH